MPGFTLDLNQLLIPAFISLLLAVFTFIVLLLNRVRRLLRSASGKPAKHSSISGNLFRFLFTLLWMAISAAIFFVAAFTQSYRNFTKREHVAIIKCIKVQEDDKTIQLELTPIEDGQPGEKQGYLLQGEQWTLEGHILKWEDWLNFAGLHTMYKLTRVRGRYLDTEDERRNKPTVYGLKEEEGRFKWQWLYKYGHRLKFVQSVYGNTVYTFPSDHYYYDVFVTTSGFSIEIREAF